MHGDVADIIGILHRAVALVASADIPETLRNSLVFRLETKIAVLREWLRLPWSPEEELTMLEFVTAWHAEELQIQRLRQHDDLSGYLHDMPAGYEPIPTLTPPSRSKNVKHDD